MGFWNRKFNVPKYKAEDFAPTPTPGATENEQVKLTIEREPMPLAFRDLGEHDVFEVGGSLFIKMSGNKEAFCFKTSRVSMIRLGPLEPDPLAHVRRVTDLYARVEGGMLTRGKFGDK